MRRLASVSICCLALAGCESELVRGNGVAAEETRTVKAFESAVVDSGLALVLDASAGAGAGDGSLTVSGDENLLPLIETTVTDGWLTVRAKQPVSSELKLEVRGSASGLLRLGATGGAGATATGIDRDGIFEASVDAGGSVTLSGRADRFDALVAGGGLLTAGELTAGEVRLQVSGGSRVRVCATDTLLVAATGGSVVTYECDPERVEPVTEGGAVVEPAE